MAPDEACALVVACRSGQDTAYAQRPALWNMAWIDFTEATATGRLSSVAAHCGMGVLDCVGFGQPPSEHPFQNLDTCIDTSSFAKRSLIDR